jgi:hypothetical protein
VRPTGSLPVAGVRSRASKLTIRPVCVLMVTALEGVPGREQ